MLTDGNAGREQSRVHRPRPNPGVVDIMAVDADQGRALANQIVGRGGGQEAMVMIISVAAPVPVPPSRDEDGMTPNVEALECADIDAGLSFPRLADDDRR
jgi:hypothetical protein